MFLTFQCGQQDGSNDWGCSVQDALSQWTQTWFSSAWTLRQPRRSGEPAAPSHRRKRTTPATCRVFTCNPSHPCSSPTTFTTTPASVPCFIPHLAKCPWQKGGMLTYHVCMSVCLSICLSVCPSVCQPVHLSVHFSVCQSVCLSVSPSVCLPVHLSVCPSICLPVNLSVCPFVCLSIPACLSVNLSICPSLRACLSVSLSVHPCLPACLSVIVLICLSICLSVHPCLPACLSVIVLICLSICLSVHPCLPGPLSICLVRLSVCSFVQLHWLLCLFLSSPFPFSPLPLLLIIDFLYCFCDFLIELKCLRLSVVNSYVLSSFLLPVAFASFLSDTC